MTFVAPAVAQTFRTVVEMAFGYSPATDPATWVWTDVSQYVRGTVTIQKGRTSLSGTADPTQIQFRLNNTDGRFSAENPMSPYWPNVVLNVPVRVSITWAGAAGTYERATAFVNGWPIQPNAGVLDVEVPILATGRLRRLRRSGKKIASALTYAIPTTSPTAWWSMEDGPNAVKLASGVTGGSPMRVFAGSVAFAAGGSPPGSDALPSFTDGGTMVGSVGTSAATTWRVEFSANFAAFDPLLYTSIMLWNTSSGVTWEVDATSLSLGGLYMQAYDASGTFIDLTTSNNLIDDGAWHRIRIDGTKSGSDTVITASIDGVTVLTHTFVGATFARVTRVVVNPMTFNGIQYSTRSLGSFGQLAIWAPWAGTLDTVAAARGFAGEAAAARFTRLCAQQGIQATAVAGLVSSQPMGPQTIDTLSNLLDSGADLDNALMHDGGVSGNLVHAPGAVRYNAAVQLTLDYRRSQIGDGYAGTKDDQNYANNTIVDRTGGSTAVAQDSTRIAIDDDYDQQDTVNAYTDDQLLGIASWRTHVDSFTGYRFPATSIDLRRNPELAQSVTALTLPARISPINLPSPPYPFGSIDQFAEGYTEIIDAVTWQIGFVSTPQPPYQVMVVASTDKAAQWVVDDAVGAWQLNAGITATQLTCAIKNSTGNLLSTAGADYPRDLYVDGEVITVTAVAGAASPQTATITRSVNGVAKSHIANAVLSLYRPATLAL